MGSNWLLLVVAIHCCAFICFTIMIDVRVTCNLKLTWCIHLQWAKYKFSISPQGYIFHINVLQKLLHLHSLALHSSCKNMVQNQSTLLRFAMKTFCVVLIAYELMLVRKYIHVQSTLFTTYRDFICGIYICVQAVTHIAVLTGQMTIEGVDLTMKTKYFSSDLISVLVCFSMTNGENSFLTLIHFIVHSTAVMHLCGVWESFFYFEVFRLAELKPSLLWISTVYMTLTLADIFCHFYNIYLLGEIIHGGKRQLLQEKQDVRQR